MLERSSRPSRQPVQVGRQAPRHADGARRLRLRSNIEPRTRPDGLDVEVFSPATLRAASELAVDAYDREHVTSVIRRNPDRFRRTSFVCSAELGNVHWSVDTEEDLRFTRELVSCLGERRYEAGLHEILETVRREPSLADHSARRT